MQFRDIMVRLKQKGFKNTPQRRTVIKTLLKLGGRPTVKEIYDEVRKSNPEISLDTVYRNLNLLTDLGIVSQMNLRFKESSRFELSPPHEHHHHLICLGCGKVVCLDACPMNKEAIAQAETKDFEIIGHAFELYGYCPVCKKVG